MWDALGKYPEASNWFQMQWSPLFCTGLSGHIGHVSCWCSIGCWFASGSNSRCWMSYLNPDMDPLLVISIQSTRMSRQEILWVPHLVGPRRRAFSRVAPSPVEHHPRRNKMGPTLALFYKASKTWFYQRAWGTQTGMEPIKWFISWIVVAGWMGGLLLFIVLYWVLVFLSTPESLKSELGRCVCVSLYVNASAF